MDFAHDRGASLALFSYGFCNFFRPRGGGLRDFFENVALAYGISSILRSRPWTGSALSETIKIPLARATFSKNIGKHKVFEWFPEELKTYRKPCARATFSEMLL